MYYDMADWQMVELVKSHATDENCKPLEMIKNLRKSGVYFGIEGVLALSLMTERPVWVYKDGHFDQYNPLEVLSEPIYTRYSGNVRGHFEELRSKVEVKVGVESTDDDLEDLILALRLRDEFEVEDAAIEADRAFALSLSI